MNFSSHAASSGVGPLPAPAGSRPRETGRVDAGIFVPA
ncbi:hypothetical protein BIWAKO_04157 [Bosea sp. BIWAKO-01]|nr:hypothetical protein BIWAKO_04157 [Bosea sp. BIWAKO-01]